MNEERLNLNLLGGMRPADQRLWSAVLLSYTYDFENSEGEVFQDAIIDFLESIETGDLELIAELAGVNFIEFLVKCDLALEKREELLWKRKNWLQ